jgi:chromosome partitioning protein
MVMAYVICVILTKGGVSKTTTAVALSEAATLGGGQVTAIDADPMGSLLRWAQLAEAVGRALRATVIGMPVQDIPRRIHPIARESSVVVIDAPPPGPGAAAIAEAAIGVSDLVVMPIPPRPADMDRVRATKEIADRHGKPARAVLTQVRGGIGPARRREQALELLQAWGVSVYKTQFGYSTAVEGAYGTYLLPSSPVMRYGMELMTEILTTEINGKVRTHG